ncbi:MAG: cyclic nucleotide-binding domain-containing protein, partial [Actinobacteria bacterium]|nr:cyclic nucleotide-binding domain-containing protein [Actinomycetota bacterium]
MASLDDRLRAVPFFRALPADDLAAISGQLHLRTVRKGAIVFREGDTADAMYLVDAGQLEVLRGSAARPVALLGAGSVAGELALLLGEPRSATVRAASTCRLWTLTREDLDRLLAAHPALALELSAELGRRLVTTTKRLAHGDVTRFTVALGDVAVPLAEAIAAESGTVGVLALRKLEVPRGIPVIPVAKLSADRLVAHAGRRFEDLDHVVVALPRTRSPLATAAVDVAEWVVTADAPSAWITARHPPARVIVVDGSVPAISSASRRVTGRAVGLALSSGGSKTVAHAG